MISVEHAQGDGNDYIAIEVDDVPRYSVEISAEGRVTFGHWHSDGTWSPLCILMPRKDDDE